MSFLKKHECWCGEVWFNNLDISTCPKLLDHTRIMRERIQERIASGAAQKEIIAAPLAEEPPIEK